MAGGYMSIDDIDTVALPPEPRTCRTCKRAGKALCGTNLINAGLRGKCPAWTPRSSQSADVSRGYKHGDAWCYICVNKFNEKCEDCVADPDSSPSNFEKTPHAPQSVDVEMVREARKYIAEIVRSAGANKGYVSCLNAVSLATHALAALDRIVGKEK